MKVIWVYENITREREQYSKFNTLLMLASVSLWKKNHPEDDTWLYCDNITHSLLKDLEVDSLYDNIQVIDFDNKAIKVEPTAPSAADSVGVAMPNNIEPKTIKIRING